MLRLKLRYEFGKSWKDLKNTATWKQIKIDLLEKVSVGLKDMIASTAAAEWKKPTGLADKSWYVTIDRNRGVATIGNTQPYMYWQNYGVIAHQMRYLLNVGEKQYLSFGKYPYWGKKFIPIMNKDGDIIYRRCTEKSIRAGGWWHPGFAGKRFVENGIDMYRIQMKKVFKDVLIRGGALK